MTAFKKVLKRTLIILGALVSALLLLLLIFFITNTIRWHRIKDTGLPRIDVVTEDGKKIKSKEEYVNCTVTLSGAEEEYCFEEVSAGIRGRGNSTWRYYPKKPYRIKFSEKTSMFGEKKNKSWVLLAMYNDFSKVKDRLAFSIADALGTDVFVPSYNYVDLYVNGKYKGIYLLTDQVDENSGRTSVKEDFAPEDVEVPFLVELDSYAQEEGAEDVAWFRLGGFLYTVKYPEEDERYTEAQFEYIKSYVKAVDSLVRKPGVTMSELSEYIDMNSFIDYYIVEELMGQMEINWKSVYMSKAVGEKLKMGPVWDFDWSVTGPHSVFRYRDKYKSDYSGLRSENNWFIYLYNGSPEFREALMSRWQEAKPEILRALSEVEAEKSKIELAARKDWYRWRGFSFTGGFSECYDEVFDWMQGRILWLDSAFYYEKET